MIQKRIILGDNDKIHVDTYIISPKENNAKRPAVIVCPGGAYLQCSPREGECVALKFNGAGYHAFVLEYSTEATAPGRCEFPTQLLELKKVMALIWEHEKEWQIDTEQVNILGFSAGGNLAGCYGSYWNSDLLKAEDRLAYRPAAVLLCYPLVDYVINEEENSKSMSTIVDMGEVTGKVDMRQMMLELTHKSNKAIAGVEEMSNEDKMRLSPAYHISEDTPPTFIWHTFEDHLVTVLQSLSYAAELKRHNISCEIHVYEKGDHGLSLADETSALKQSQIEPHIATWFDLAVEWLQYRKRI